MIEFQNIECDLKINKKEFHIIGDFNIRKICTRLIS